MRLVLDICREDVEAVLAAAAPDAPVPDAPDAAAAPASAEESDTAEPAAEELATLEPVAAGQAIAERPPAVVRLTPAAAPAEPVVQPALDTPGPVHPYFRGSWGPAEADRILGGDHWFDPV